MKLNTQTLYSIPNGSLAVEIVRVKYSNNEYAKCHIRYYTRGSLILVSETRNQKLWFNRISHWEKV